MTDDEIQAQAALIALLPARTRLRNEQEKAFVVTLLGVAPRAAGRLALAWWGDTQHSNHIFLTMVLRGIRTREPEQALHVFDALREAPQRIEMQGWLRSLDYATETQTLLKLLQRSTQMTWTDDKNVLVFEDLIDAVRFQEPAVRRELAEALLAVVKILPPTEQQQRLAVRAQMLLAMG
ncbi:MAG: hypothetical protein QM758_03900 [Armatimonas sp.]